MSQAKQCLLPLVNKPLKMPAKPTKGKRSFEWSRRVIFESRGLVFDYGKGSSQSVARLVLVRRERRAVNEAQ